MITCQHVRQLFDRYLDGELSPSLQAELHAHQLSCSACQSELAMLETCGDVIALDRCEPSLSESFTDRVLLARRAQLARRPRRWGRVALLAGAPMAAAASLFLAVMLTMPESRPTVGVTAGISMAAPSGFADVARVLSGTPPRSLEAQRELDSTRPMPAAGFMDALLARVVEQTQDGVEGTRNGLNELELLLRQAFSGANEKLVARWRSAQDKGTSTEAPAERSTIDLEFMGPPYLTSEPSDESAAEPPLLDPL